MPPSNVNTRPSPFKVITTRNWWKRCFWLYYTYYYTM